MADFLTRRRADRAAAAAFWQAWPQAQIEGVADGKAWQHRANQLLSGHFPDLFLQVTQCDAQGRVQSVAVSSANRIAPMAQAQLLCHSAPQNLPFTLHAGIVRVPPPQLQQAQSQFAGAHLTAHALQVACRDEGDGLVHLSVFADSGLPPEHSGQHVAAWRLLAQALGEWDVNVKTGSIAFEAEPPADAVGLMQLAEHFDQFWAQTLQHNGQLPPLPHAYATYTETVEADNDSDAPETVPTMPALWVRNESAAAIMGEPQAPWCVSITCEVYDALSQKWTEEIRQALAGVVVSAGGVLTTAFSDWTEGRFQVCAAVGEPDAAFAATQAIAKAYDRLDARADCVFDPSWHHYRI